MTHRVITVSYTPLDAAGGVPRWNRDFHSAFPDRECLHYSWCDHPASQDATGCNFLSEPDKAKVLNQYLLQKRLVTPDDVIVADGFWLSGLEHLPRAVSVCHGIWGHITKDDRDAGKQPENAFLHAAQVAYRQKLWEIGGNMVSVSNFIADEMEKQWGWKVPVINTGIDLDMWKTAGSWPRRDTFGEFGTVVHPVNDRGNVNKGWDHIEAVKKKLRDPVNVLSLDELVEVTGLPKNQALAKADICVIPSGFEGNSLFCLETLACDVPIVAYDVGLPYLAKKQKARIGTILDRRERSPEKTAEAALMALSNSGAWWRNEGVRAVRPRQWVSQFSIENFRQQWRDYVEKLG